MAFFDHILRKWLDFSIQERLDLNNLHASLSHAFSDQLHEYPKIFHCQVILLVCLLQFLQVIATFSPQNNAENHYELFYLESHVYTLEIFS